MLTKRINQLDERTPELTDLMIVGDPLTGYSYKANISDIIAFISANIGTVKKRFIVGDVGYPGDGDTTWTDADFEDATVWLYRNSILSDWADPGDGSSYHTQSGDTITFSTALALGEKIQALVIKI
jgi:hypothetical protein